MFSLIDKRPYASGASLCTFSEVSADTRIAVIGIADQSFTQPDILLSATVDTNAGYFGERLNTARKELVHAWKTRSAKLKPRYRQTDILGALTLAGQIFDQQADAKEKKLIVYSDMRHHTRELDLESPATMPSTAQMVTACATLSGLSGIELHVLGTGDSGRSIAEWDSLRALWPKCFTSGGANMRHYSVMR